MIQFQVLTGKQAGARWVARRFPVRVGRAAANDLRLEEDGVWDRHCVLNFDPAEGFILTAQPDALLTVNQEPTRSIRLRNGDAIAMGSARLQFWLNETPRRGQRLREGFVWTLVVVICLTEVALVYWLLR
ncbi:MAG: FHA domain-containing protein [Verrucomicrobia bacterium]|jgi:pSer/pThr/pTyr-binding forkhead associated (FHA) protein|nr:FHA domain-containing protein [Verrucomicrobiota bacterium]